MHKLLNMPLPIVVAALQGAAEAMAPDLSGMQNWGVVTAFCAGIFTLLYLLEKIGVLTLLRQRLIQSGRIEDRRQGDTTVLDALAEVRNRSQQAVRLVGELQEETAAIKEDTGLLVEQHAGDMGELRHEELKSLGVDEHVWHNRTVILTLRDNQRATTSLVERVEALMHGVGDLVGKVDELVEAVRQAAQTNLSRAQANEALHSELVGKMDVLESAVADLATKVVSRDTA